MKKDEGDFRDPWLNEREETAKIPADARFVCSYTLDLGPVTVEEAVFFRRTNLTDELWIAQGEDSWFSRRSRRDFLIGCAFAVRKKGTKSSACLTLLGDLVRARSRFYWPGRFVQKGMVNKSTFANLLWGIRRERDENTRKALQNETEIIKVARELGLDPQPTGTGPTHWQVRCLRGRNHPAYIDSAHNYFFCGWCGYKGGVEDLRRWVDPNYSQTATA